jgi:hypothetical protein
MSCVDGKFLWGFPTIFLKEISLYSYQIFRFVIAEHILKTWEAIFYNCGVSATGVKTLKHNLHNFTT